MPLSMGRAYVCSNPWHLCFVSPSCWQVALTSTLALRHLVLLVPLLAALFRNSCNKQFPKQFPALCRVRAVGGVRVVVSALSRYQFTGSYPMFCSKDLSVHEEVDKPCLMCMALRKWPYMRVPDCCMICSVNVSLSTMKLRKLRHQSSS